MTVDQAPGAAPAGWYDDPERPGEGRQRRWDGSEWTNEYRDTSRRSPWTPAVLVGGSVLVATAVASTLIAADRRVFNPAETIGYALGGLIFPLALAFVGRWLYVKLFARDRPVWTDGIVVAAAILAVLALLGAVGRAAQDADTSANAQGAGLGSPERAPAAGYAAKWVA